MMLMGNSFFRPYAEKLGELAVDAGYTDHNANVVFRGGDNGRPLNLWNDVTASAEVKTVLDAGNIDMFGMVSTPYDCLLYTSPSPRDISGSRMPSSA